MGRGNDQQEHKASSGLPLISLNHVSYQCRSVGNSLNFYHEILGFHVVKRPSSLKFQGAWLYNYGLGIHLIECDSLRGRKEEVPVINPKDNHIAFQCSDMEVLKLKLEHVGVNYVTAIVEDEGVVVEQVFLHDPEGHMIEICNCNNIPVLRTSILR